MSSPSETDGGVGVIELTETEKQKAPGDAERYAHYVRKDKATASAVTGRPVVALCGKVWVPMRNPQGYPVCPECKRILKKLDGAGAGWPFSGNI